MYLEDNFFIYIDRGRQIKKKSQSEIDRKKIETNTDIQILTKTDRRKK